MGFDIGDLVRLTVEFRDADGNLSDPATVSLTLTNVNGSTTKTYAAGEVQRLSLGSFYYDAVVDVSGVWYYRWQSTGVPTLAEEGEFVVDRRRT